MSACVSFDEAGGAWFCSHGAFEELFERILNALDSFPAPMASKEITVALIAHPYFDFYALPLDEKRSVLAATRVAERGFWKEAPSFATSGEERLKLWRRHWRGLIDGMERNLREPTSAAET